mmetsp:Transcript_14717/g.27948  ORF Transcript_14717/g.27948 Transcript_14717/m.27948 type:complete len:345 (-) Transcript_14717:177-1211(-)|eukprot:scaffold4442_cov125-Amphora_coffeaeformis.AAC.19
MSNTPDNANNNSSSSLQFDEVCCPDMIHADDEEESLHMSGLSRENSTDDLFTIPIDDSRFGNSQSTGLTFNTTSSTKTVELVSPANLPAGYQFVARVGEEQVVVEVFKPVVTGQRFQAMVVRKNTKSKRKLLAQPGHFIPYGRWRDGLMNLFRFGVCHPVFCLACWCSPLLLAQVMSRVGLDLWGKPTTDGELPVKNVGGEDQNNEKKPQWSVFRWLSTIFVIHFVLVETILSAVVMIQIHARREGRISEVPAWAFMLLAIRATCRSALLLYVLVASYRTRLAIRTRYGIPEQHLEYGVEDVAVTLACHPCSVAQMARHTADYDTYDAMCCTTTGLSSYAPSWV